MARIVFLSLLCFIIAMCPLSKVNAQGEKHDRETIVPSFIGGDLFLSGEIYGIHLLDNAGSLTTGGGIGAEVRVYPLFLGAVVGNCGDEGLPDLHPAGTFSFYSLYGGTTIKNYRIEIGEIIADNGSWTTATPSNYTVVYVGISKRWSDVFFFEPEAKIIFPVEAAGYREIWTPINEPYHLRDLFFGLNLKIGIGFN